MFVTLCTFMRKRRKDRRRGSFIMFIASQTHNLILKIKRKRGERINRKKY